MLQVSGWVRILVAVILLAGFAIALPNALPDSVRAKFPSWLPNQTVALGLDLQGGSYLLLEVELDTVDKDKIESLTGDIRRALRKARPLHRLPLRARPGRRRGRPDHRPRPPRRGEGTDPGPQSHDRRQRARGRRPGL